MSLHDNPDGPVFKRVRESFRIGCTRIMPKPSRGEKERGQSSAQQGAIAKNLIEERQHHQADGGDSQDVDEFGKTFAHELET